MEAENRLREAEASLARLEKAVEKQVTSKKSAAVEKEVAAYQTCERRDTVEEEDHKKAEEEMIADVRTLKRKDCLSLRRIKDNYRNNAVKVLILFG